MGANTYLTERERGILENAKVGIAGAGGLGSNVAMLLVRAGMKKLVIADFDIVNESNLNRQFFFRHQLGEKKIDALAARLEHEAKVKFSQGAIYGEPKGNAFLRINLACPRTTLMDALERFAKWIEVHSDRFPDRGDRYFTKGLFAT